MSGSARGRHRSTEKREKESERVMKEEERKTSLLVEKEKWEHPLNERQRSGEV